MDINNLEEAQQLGKELEQLRLARDLIIGNGVMKLCSKDMRFIAVVEDSEVTERAVNAILRRIDDISERIKEL